MADNDESNLPVEINYFDGSLFDPILDDFDTTLSLYDQVMNRVDPEVFDRLNTKKKSSAAGLAFIDGGIYEEKLSLAGRATASDDVITKNLSVAGSTSFQGMLAVANKASIAGSCTVKDNGLFGGSLSVGGKVSFHRNLVLSGGLKLGGSLDVAEYILADSSLSIGGRLKAESVRSNNELKLSGKIYVDQDVIARDIILRGVNGYISGNMYAQSIQDQSKEEEISRDLTTVGGLISYIVNTLKRAITGSSNRDLIVAGDVIADNIELDNLTIHGDIYGKSIKIGKNTDISGKIYYSEEIELPEGHDLDVIKGLPKSITSNKPDGSIEDK